MAKQSTEIVVVGAGYAGLLATVRMAGGLRHQPARITLVNASDVFVERLRLHQFAAQQAVKHRPLTRVLRGTGVNFIHGYVNRIDTAQRALLVQTYAETRSVHYDYLLYALGSTLDRDSVRGVREHAYTLTPSGPLSAAALRERLPVRNDAGGRLVVCGGGATGIEAAAEFADAYPNLRVHLVTRGAFGQFLGESVTAYMRQSLEQRRVMIQDHTTVADVRANDIQTNAGAVAYDLCLWAGGFVAPPLARESGLVVNERGQVLIDPFMRSVSHPEIFAVGDAAHPLEEPGVRVRMSAFTAIILGAHGADCLSAMLQDKAPRPLSFAYMGQGIALGRQNAIGFNNYPDDTPHPPYFTGRLGCEIREFFVRFLAEAASLERRWPGFFFWVGKERYGASKRGTHRRASVEPSL